MSPRRLTSYDFSTAAIDTKAGTFTSRWQELMRLLFGDVAAFEALPSVIHQWALADQPSLGSSDANYVAFVTDYGLFVRWTGSVWEFAPGSSGNKFLRLFAGAPQEVGWGLCDGSTYSYVVVGGATLTTANFTTPNLTGSTAFLKTIAAYTGTIDAAVAPGMSGATAPGTIPGFHTGIDTSSISNVLLAGGGSDVLSLHLHDHVVGDLTVPALGAGSLAVDDMARPPAVGFVPFFKR